MPPFKEGDIVRLVDARDQTNGRELDRYVRYKNKDLVIYHIAQSSGEWMVGWHVKDDPHDNYGGLAWRLSLAIPTELKPKMTGNQIRLFLTA